MNYDGKVICAVKPAALAMAASRTCQWNKTKIGVTIIESKLPGIHLDEHVQAVQLALAAWNEVCGLECFYTTNARTSDIRIYSQRIDGMGNVLAESYLPCSGRDDPLTQRYDAGDQWVIWDKDGAPPAGKIDIGRVTMHELGHALGLGHSPEPDMLMSPTYSIKIRRPRIWEINEMIRRYGRRLLPLPPVVPAPAPSAPEPRKTMDPARTQEVINQILKWGRTIATATVWTDKDDKIVDSAEQLLTNPFVVTLLTFLLNRFQNQAVIAEADFAQALSEFKFTAAA